MKTTIDFNRLNDRVVDRLKYNRLKKESDKLIDKARCLRKDDPKRKELISKWENLCDKQCSILNKKY